MSKTIDGNSSESCSPRVAPVLGSGVPPQTETYSWTKVKTSNENYSRPGNFSSRVDIDTNAPVLAERKIFRSGTDYITSYSNFDAYGNPATIAESGPNGGNRTRSEERRVGKECRL